MLRHPAGPVFGRARGASRRGRPINARCACCMRPRRPHLRPSPACKPPRPAHQRTMCMSHVSAPAPFSAEPGVQVAALAESTHSVHVARLRAGPVSVQSACCTLPSPPNQRTVFMLHVSAPAPSVCTPPVALFRTRRINAQYACCTPPRRPGQPALSTVRGRKSLPSTHNVHRVRLQSRPVYLHLHRVWLQTAPINAQCASCAATKPARLCARCSCLPAAR
jgi:hypothetical protein